MTTNQIPTTQNEAWGFWGTMNEHASAAWPLAMNTISDATHQPLEPGSFLATPEELLAKAEQALAAAQAAGGDRVVSLG